MVWKKEKQWKTNYTNKYKIEKAFKPELNIPKISRSLLVCLILLVMVSVLAYFNFATGGYTRVLEEGKASIQDQLDTCNTEKQTLTSDLSTCNTDLGECDTDLSTKTTSLSTCESEMSEYKDDLDLCEGGLSSSESDYRVCVSDLEDFDEVLDEYDCDDPDELDDYIRDVRTDRNEYEDDLDDCQTDKNSLQSNYDSIKEYYAEYKCCPLNITYYRILANNVDCTNNTADIHITC